MMDVGYFVGTIVGYVVGYFGLAYLIVRFWAKRAEGRTVGAGKVIAVGLGLIVLMTAGRIGDQQDAGSEGIKVTKSIDGQFQITMPSSWSVQTDLHDGADIQVANPLKKYYVVVLTESKADLEDSTIGWHSELTRTMVLEALSGGHITDGPQELQLDGQPAVQFEIRGATEGTRIVYLHTTVDTGEHLHQILAWTLPSDYGSGRAVLQSVVHSFKSTPKDQ